jgi:hypothetical protein
VKKSILHIIILSFARVVVFISCQKEISCEDCKDANKPPISIAGPDQVITLPTDSISLDASSDPDGKISGWLWTKILGPASLISKVFIAYELKHLSISNPDCVILTSCH